MEIKLIDNILKEVAKVNGIDINIGENTGEANSMVIARLSQSAEPFSKIVTEILAGHGLDKNKIIDFHKRITIGWGHHSIEQHAISSLAFEEVSILAANRYIENKRLAAYLERSTRYQDYSEPKYYVPEEFDEELKKDYNSAIIGLFDAYQKVLPLFKEEIKRIWTEKGLPTDDSKIQKKAFDCARYLLPSSTLTNLAMTANAQCYRSLIHDLKSFENKELGLIAKKMVDELSQVFPALINNEIAVCDVSRTKLKEVSREVIESFDFTDQSVKLTDYTQNNIKRIIEQYSLVSGKTFSSESDALNELFNYNSCEEKAHRVTELANYYFETTLDFGAGRDVHRNRMLTWIASNVSPKYGYSKPLYMTEEIEKIYLDAMQNAFNCWKKIVGVHGEEIAQYVLPLGTNYKIFYSINARELQHVAKTRTTSHAHYAYRKYVHNLVEEVKKADPLIGNQLKDFFEEEI